MVWIYFMLNWFKAKIIQFKQKIIVLLFIMNCLLRQTKKIILRTSGRQKKNFLSILDLFCAINFLLNKPYEELNDGIFNLGSDNTISVIEMAQLIHDRAETVLGISSELVISETNNEYVNSKLDYKSNKLKEIGFTCHGNIIDEIDQTLKFCKINFTWGGEGEN